MSEGYKPPEQQDNSWMGCVFWLGIILAILLAMFFSGCSVTKYVDREKIVYRDSTIVKRETHDSLIYVQMPLEKGQVIVQVGDTSRLETSIARSEAFVGGDGFLHHSLENKREKVPVLVPVTGTYIYSGVSQEKAQVITKIEKVEKSLTWWQSVKIGAFWWLAGAVLALLLWIFKKPIIALLKLWLKF